MITFPSIRFTLFGFIKVTFADKDIKQILSALLKGAKLDDVVSVLTALNADQSAS